MGNKESTGTLIAFYIILFIFVALPLAYVTQGIFRFILPIVEDNEYYVDRHGWVHDGMRECRNSRWFRTKRDKYGFMRKNSWDYCPICFEDGDKAYKMEAVSDINKEQHAWQIRHDPDYN